ncbi:hypothetical protein MSMTP_1450 [Methanosarcina sp. MTP4]|uniref:methylamine utilization protein MauJ n=1 Tax=Methanosarcina sp. MTP4 TaxID=1434100 RepID=UPI000615F288|nr:hypothetical protein [Methanosarcina sp. MTP4]AKB24919.1 hypothetical protein MSMTP_1450 [Methanosarcina sp. MTP4]
MARLGGIHLGGTKNISPNQTFNSGVGFFLASNSEISKLYSLNCRSNESFPLVTEIEKTFSFFDETPPLSIENNETFSLDDGMWEVEVKKDHKSIVARCPHSLSPGQILKYGFEACQKALDLISVIHKKNMILKDPGTSHILLFKEKNKYILREVSMVDLAISFEVSVTKMDKNGNIVPEPVQPEPEWLPAFRYYRLSQSTNDLYEAYRNLYLGFESLLNEIHTKSKEGEGKWLKDALYSINKKINLSEYVPSERMENPVDFIFKNQYISTRCPLFHAKDKVILPHALLNPEQVSTEYRRLIEIWHAIVSRYFNVSPSGGLVTDQGFKALMGGMFDNGFTFQVTDDPTPLSPDDSVVSPLNHPVISLNDIEFKKDHALCQVMLAGNLEGTGLKKIELIHRIGLLKEGLITEEFIDDGLFLEGVDRMEINQTIRLINKNKPKTEF